MGKESPLARSNGVCGHQYLRNHGSEEGRGKKFVVALPTPNGEMQFRSLASTSFSLRIRFPGQWPVVVLNTVLEHPEVLIQGRLKALNYEPGLSKGQECHSLTGKHRQCPTPFVFTASSDLISMRKSVRHSFICFQWMWDTFQSATLTAWENVVLYLPSKEGQERKQLQRLDILCLPSLIRSYQLRRCTSK